MCPESSCRCGQTDHSGYERPRTDEHSGVDSAAFQQSLWIILMTNISIPVSRVMGPLSHGPELLVIPSVIRCVGR